MEVKAGRKNKKMTFGDIPVGGNFIDCDALCIKVQFESDDNKEYKVCVNLETGYSVEMADDYPVLSCCAEATWTL